MGTVGVGCIGTACPARVLQVSLGGMSSDMLFLWASGSSLFFLMRSASWLALKKSFRTPWLLGKGVGIGGAADGPLTLDPNECIGVSCVMSREKCFFFLYPGSFSLSV